MTDSRRLSRARWATRAQFLHLGAIAGVWSVHVPSIKLTYALDDRMLAAVFSRIAFPTSC